MPFDDDAESQPRLLRMVRQHVESLRTAGIEWVGAGSASVRELESESVDRPTVADSPPSKSLAHSPSPIVESAVDLFAERPPAEPTMNTEQKRQALHVLDTQVRSCTRCAALVQNRTQTVFGVGNPDAELCFVGEAPGMDEDREGEPFVGPAGQLLNSIITKGLKMRREDVYICNVLKCRPPGNRTPLPDEVAHCRGYLEEQLSIIRPKFICALGAPAAQWLTGSMLTIGKLRGRFHDYRGIPVMPTYHPAYLLRTPSAKADVWEDLKKLLARMGRPVG
jgi:DNA polymerase